MYHIDIYMTYIYAQLYGKLKYVMYKKASRKVI